jgi:hypothetical protein
VSSDVSVDGFWPISVYNAAGYFEKNTLDAYAINNLTAKKDSDGSITVQFGGCDGKTPNGTPDPRVARRRRALACGHVGNPLAEIPQLVAVANWVG